MQVFRSVPNSDHALVGFGVRVLLLTDEASTDPLARKLGALGGQIDIITEMFTALSEVIEDPLGYALFVIDCDSAGIGGLEGGQRAIHRLGEASGRISVILISKDCKEQSFPEDRLAPTQLRAPLSTVSLRVGFEHALRDRLAYRKAFV
jgi:hypothetical protein